ncbi:hypothetical protein K432DRAFT_464338 [Lepidopterella palustris CBS 459.81]|uniref:Uncharacterized protein n=1 Tax=Lepidopterella palustris CBS 459.81 TaxID=1314670 RepID=A0A8E2JJ30_9PEZI|nr:hypothetical protein K432DRAFT_464338 [Lepidopterella palustris CBS 459.81]
MASATNLKLNSKTQPIAQSAASKASAATTKTAAQPTAQSAASNLQAATSNPAFSNSSTIPSLESKSDFPSLRVSPNTTTTTPKNAPKGGTPPSAAATNQWPHPAPKSAPNVTTLPKNLPAPTPMFILLPGNFTGDLWHCAAAGLLATRDKNKVIQGYPIIVLGIEESEFIGPVRVLEEPSESFRQGRPSYEYFWSIGVPCFLARMSRKIVSNANPKTTLQEAISDLKHGESYFKHMALVYQSMTARKDVNSVETNPLEDNQLFNHNKAASVFTASNQPQPAKFVWEYPGEGFQLDILQVLHLWNSTSIVMQYLSNRKPEIVNESLQALRDCLAPEPGNDDVDWYSDAAKLVGELKMIIEGWKDVEAPGPRFIPFNYREGDVNIQHDSSLDLLRSFHKIANKVGKGYFRIIPIMVGLKDDGKKKAANDLLKELYDDAVAKNMEKLYIDLYPKTGRYDKRYTARFWAIVTKTMNDLVFGLIGGRSGSIDVASFMGMNTCSWDEPVLDPKNLCNYPPSRAAYWNSQKKQYLRLYNQYPCMSIIMLDPTSKNNLASKDYNVYRELDAASTEAWLTKSRSDENGTTPVKPELAFRNEPRSSSRPSQCTRFPRVAEFFNGERIYRKK